MSNMRVPKGHSLVRQCISFQLWAHVPRSLSSLSLLSLPSPSSSTSYDRLSNTSLKAMASTLSLCRLISFPKHFLSVFYAFPMLFESFSYAFCVLFLCFLSRFPYVSSFPHNARRVVALSTLNCSLEGRLVGAGIPRNHRSRARSTADLPSASPAFSFYLAFLAIPPSSHHLHTVFIGLRAIATVRLRTSRWDRVRSRRGKRRSTRRTTLHTTSVSAHTRSLCLPPENRPGTTSSHDEPHLTLFT